MAPFATPTAGDEPAAARPAPAGRADEIKDAGMLLPSFAKQRPGGLFITRAEIGNLDRFSKFLDQVLSTPAYHAFSLHYMREICLYKIEELYSLAASCTRRASMPPTASFANFNDEL